MGFAVSALRMPLGYAQGVDPGAGDVVFTERVKFFL